MQTEDIYGKGTKKEEMCELAINWDMTDYWN